MLISCSVKSCAYDFITSKNEKNKFFQKEKNKIKVMMKSYGDKLSHKKLCTSHQLPNIVVSN